MVVYLENIVNEYESLVDLNDISIILSNNDKIHFRFKMENLPHLLGFQHVTDIPLFYKYSENQIYANQLLKAIRHGSIKQNEIDSSKLFKEVYDKRMKYFTYDRIYNMLLNGNISSFNPKKIKHFDTRLDKIDYIMWENFNGGYSHLGLGFSIKGNKGHPNTFFYRDNRDYVENQEMHTKLTLNIARPVNQENKLFKIYWENIYDS